MRQDKYITQIAERNIRIDLRNKRSLILAEQTKAHPDFWVKVDKLLPQLSNDKRLLLADLIHQHFKD